MHREARISNYILAGLSALSLTLMALPLSGPVRAFKTCVVYVLNPVAFHGARGVERVAGVPGRVRELLAADMRNRELEESLKESLWVKAEAEVLKGENARLRSAVGLKAPAGFSPLWARLMERDPLHWYRSIMVEAGLDDGLAVNTPVLGRRGDSLAAVGRVVEVRPRSLVVLLVTDELSSVAAYLSSSTLEGLVQGQGSARLLMNYLPSDASLSPGEMVFTSPTSATFPPDVLVGTVSKVNPRDPFLTFQSVEVQAAVDPSALKEVLLLRRPQSARGGAVSK